MKTAVVDYVVTDEQIADLMVERLNTLLALDPKTMCELFEQRVPCSAEFAEHPTVQVRDGAEGPTVGVLGLLNGLTGVDLKANGLIAAEYDHGRLVRFVRTGAA